MSNEAKKAGPVEHAQHTEKKPETQAKGGKNQGQNQLPGGCQCWGCKKEGQQFNFCHEHYEHFKFGLIKKTGEQVSDYEKKFEHYMAWKSKQRTAHKVA
jgi:hypothetical protein